MSFLDDQFLLSNQHSSRLYEIAKNQPIIDYHSHLCPKTIAENKPFENLNKIWVKGDHYKWRAMRAAGVSEKYCTGNATDKEKFLAWAATVPKTLRNPLFHWTHLELRRYFQIDSILDASNGESIWDKCNSLLSTDDFLPRSILRNFQVKVLCTTDDPADPLTYHEILSKEDLGFRVLPTFRPDKAFGVGDSVAWNQWIDRLAATTNLQIDSLEDLLSALARRHQDFHELGGRLSDHGFSYMPSIEGTEEEAKAVFQKARDQRKENADIDSQSVDRFSGFLMRQISAWDFEKGWTKQLHLGAIRNTNSRLFHNIGPDIGCDSIGDWPQVERLCRFLDDLDSRGTLPKTIVYNLNPSDNYSIATAVGNYQDGSLQGKLQWGSGWWFLDQKEGMTWQINALSQLGLLSNFVGMLTDSRSFMSFPRHEYFRRILCDLIGTDIQNGEIPNVPELVDPMIENICYQNANRLLGF